MNITLTQTAKEKIIELTDGEKNNKFRIGVAGGGCSGFEYVFAFEEKQQDDDWLVEHELNGHKIFILIDATCSSYLKNSVVDYKQDIKGERFVVENPNAVATCSCGSSFAVE